MKYKLINSQTKEEHLCDKVTIDGFDYYVDNKVVTERFEGYLIDDEGFIRHGMSCEKSIKSLNGKKVIATNNPNIDIPKVKEMSDYLAKQLNKQSFDDYGYPKWDEGKLFHRQMGFIDGYNKSQETYPFSENDMIDFILWKDENKFSIISTKEDWVSELLEYSGCVYTSKELLRLWKEQQPKIVYYDK